MEVLGRVRPAARSKQTDIFVIFVVAVVTALTPGKAATKVIDAQGNLYIATSRTEANAPVTSNAFQLKFQSAVCGYNYVPGPHGTAGTSISIACNHGHIQKISADGTKLLVGTYLGGSKDSVISAIAVDPAGRIYAVGKTTSPDFPVTAAAYQTKPSESRRNFLSALSPDGSKLLYSTFFDFGDVSELLLDPAGRVVVAGSTSGADFPVTVPAATNNEAGRNDGYVAWFDASLSKLEFARLIGGSMEDRVAAAALDQSGNLYVTGFTSSTPPSAGVSKPQPYTAFPVTPGALQMVPGWAAAFVIKFAPSGSVLFSSLIGASRWDVPSSLSIDASGNVYIAGTTESTDFPVTPGAFRSAYSPAFAAKLSSDGSRLLYATFLGATGSPGTAVDSAGNQLVIGSYLPHQFNFPTTPDAFQPCLTAAQSQQGAYYFLQLAPDGSNAIYSSFLPAPFVPQGAAAGFIALDPNGRVLIQSRTKLFDVFDVKSRPPPGITYVANGATYRSGPTAPGEIVSIFGPSIGPKQPLHLQLTRGRVDADLGGASVYFNGIAAPLLYVSENQINAVVPFGVAEREQCTVQIVNQGAVLPPVALSVAESAIGIFTLDGSGSGQAAVLNEDGTPNDYLHPARRGSVVSVFVTGAGRMQPPVTDGSLGEGRTTPVQTLYASLGGGLPEVLYAGDAPGLVQGVVQVNFRIPRVSAVGWLPLVIRSGGWNPDRAQQALVWLAVE